eukprot:4615770-Prymnesium_polylepis.4
MVDPSTNLAQRSAPYAALGVDDLPRVVDAVCLPGPGALAPCAPARLASEGRASDGSGRVAGVAVREPRRRAGAGENSHG